VVRLAGGMAGGADAGYAAWWTNPAFGPDDAGHSIGSCPPALCRSRLTLSDMPQFRIAEAVQLLGVSDDTVRQRA
jgi:hypothetical protein